MLKVHTLMQLYGNLGLRVTDSANMDGAVPLQESEGGKKGRIGADEMAVLCESPMWKEIDLAESYMVCSMFKEAATLASSIIRQIFSTTSVEAMDSKELAAMLESTGMVFVQSLKELGRTQELFVELEMLFGSVAVIPVQVFLMGACMQISEGCSSNLRPIFEEFLGKWVYLGGKFYRVPKEQEISFAKECVHQLVMSEDKYLEVVEVYAITLLGMVLHKPDIAISWTERAELPEGKRQDMLRRLRTLHLVTESSSSFRPGTVHTGEGPGDQSASKAGSNLSRGKSVSKSRLQHHLIVESEPNTSKLIQPSLKSISDRINLCFWWFRTARFNFGNVRLIIPQGKFMLLGPLMVFTFYILRKRSAVLKRFAAEKAASIRKALVDAWQLAFSVNVNPLAAVQQLPSSAPRGSR